MPTSSCSTRSCIATRRRTQRAPGRRRAYDICWLPAHPSYGMGFSTWPRDRVAPFARSTESAAADHRERRCDEVVLGDRRGEADRLDEQPLQHTDEPAG